MDSNETQGQNANYECKGDFFYEEILGECCVTRDVVRENVYQPHGAVIQTQSHCCARFQDNGRES